MKIFNKVQGSKEASKELIVDENNIVFVHSNVRKISIDELRTMYPDNISDEELAKIDLYEYDEIQYTKDEYIEVLANKNKELNNQIIDTQLALVELYEEINK